MKTPVPRFTSTFLWMCAATIGCMDSREAGLIRIDGSSTVYPIQEAIAEEYLLREGGRVVIGISGTGGGMKKFCQGEVAIVGASRAIKPSEIRLCEDRGVQFIELPVALDGIVVAVNSENDWVDHLTVEQLKRMWEPEAQQSVMRWSDVDPSWPDEPLRLMGPGVDSGTYDYFTEAIVGEEGASRGDIISSEDDNVLVTGVLKDRNALAFFGYAYYEENKSRLEGVPIDDEKPTGKQGPVAPSPDTIASGMYQPLSRPLMIYVRAEDAEREAVQQFVSFYLDNARELVPDVGFIPMLQPTYERVRARFEARRIGTLFDRGPKVGATVDELLGRDDE